VWLAVGGLLAVGATVVLVLAEDLRFLRLGILAALWAALIGTFVATRYRKKAAETEASAAKSQEIYELELEREIAARHEFELEVEAETRQRVEEESRAELEELRAEISSLRENLQALFGGEVMWERIALTAQSTRMRSFADHRPIVTAGEAADKPRLTAGRAENPTEFIGRVVDADAGDAGAIAKAIGGVSQETRADDGTGARDDADHGSANVSHNGSRNGSQNGTRNGAGSGFAVGPSQHPARRQPPARQQSARRPAAPQPAQSAQSAQSQSSRRDDAAVQSTAWFQAAAPQSATNGTNGANGANGSRNGSETGPDHDVDDADGVVEAAPPRRPQQSQ